MKRHKNNRRPLLFTVISFLCFLPAALLLQAAPVRAQAPDQYEEDNSFADAGVIFLDSELSSEAVQQHTFHRAEDEDWVKFYGVAQEQYEIMAGNPGPGCDPVIELYDTDGISLIFSMNHGIEGEEELLSWQCPADGIYFVNVRHADPAFFGEDAGYDLKVYRPLGSSSGVIAGTITDAATGGPVEGAVITTDGGGSALSDGGYFLLLHVAGTFTLVARADTYETFSAAVTVEPGGSSEITISAVPEDRDGDDPSVCLAAHILPLNSHRSERLKIFRDRVLARSYPGRLFINWYYDYGSIAVRLCESAPGLKKTARLLLSAFMPVLENLVCAEENQQPVSGHN